MAGPDYRQATFAQSRLNIDLKTALEIIEQFEKHRAWEYSPHKTRADFYQYWVKIDPENLDRIREGYKVLVGRGVVATNWREAVEAIAPMHKRGAGQLGKTRGPYKKNTDISNGGKNIRKYSGRRDSKYLIARLERDRPDIAERLAKGEFRSVYAAAKEAGFTFMNKQALYQLRCYWRKASAEERATFLAEIGKG